MIFQTLASGSNGNASVFSTNEYAVLFDAGISRKQIVAGLKEINIQPSHVKYVCITHAHWDHIRGLPVLMNHLNSAKVVASWDTLTELRKKKEQDSRYATIVDKAIGIEFEDNIPFKEGLTISAYPTVHDIDGASGFSLQDMKSEFRVSYATDTAGVSSDYLDILYDSDLIFLESNHDSSMLDKSKRPYFLKERIKQTHLSNKNFMELLKQFHSEKTKAVFVGHLSGECNSEAIVYDQLAKYSRKNPLDWAICSRHRKSAKLHINNKNTVFEGGLTNIHDDRTENELLHYFS